MDVDLFDNILIESTKIAYEKLRTPGRYIYDKSIGEQTIEEYN